MYGQESSRQLKTPTPVHAGPAWALENYMDLTRVWNLWRESVQGNF
ncbi:MAG: hypothetical protein ACLU98_14170 [Desulfovibrio fairfieldensis]